MSDIVIFEEDTGPVEVRLEGETVWLSQKQMAELFGRDLRTISEHVGNVYEEDELGREATIRKFRIVRQEGNRQMSSFPWATASNPSGACASANGPPASSANI